MDICLFLFVLLEQDARGFDQLLGDDQCGGSAKATKVVTVTTQR